MSCEHPLNIVHRHKTRNIWWVVVVENVKCFFQLLSTKILYKHWNAKLVKDIYISITICFLQTFMYLCLFIRQVCKVTFLELTLLHNPISQISLQTLFQLWSVKESSLFRGLFINQKSEHFLSFCSLSYYFNLRQQ